MDRSKITLSKILRGWWGEQSQSFKKKIRFFPKTIGTPAPPGFACRCRKGSWFGDINEDHINMDHVDVYYHEDAYGLGIHPIVTWQKKLYPADPDFFKKLKSALLERHGMCSHDSLYE